MSFDFEWKIWDISRDIEEGLDDFGLLMFEVHYNVGKLWNN